MLSHLQVEKAAIHSKDVLCRDSIYRLGTDDWILLSKNMYCVTSSIHALVIKKRKT